MGTWAEVVGALEAIEEEMREYPDDEPDVQRIKAHLTRALAIVRSLADA